MYGKVRLFKIKLVSHNHKAISSETKIQTQSLVDLMLLLIKNKTKQYIYIYVYVYIYIYTTIYLSTPHSSPNHITTIVYCFYIAQHAFVEHLF